MHRETSEYFGDAFVVLCLPSPIIAAFLRLKLERRKKPYLLHTSSSTCWSVSLEIYSRILISDQIMRFFVAFHIKVFDKHPVCFIIFVGLILRCNSLLEKS